MPPSMPSDRPAEPLQAHVLCTSLAADAEPLAVLRAFGAEGGRRLLLESAGIPEEGAPATIERSVVVLRPWLHLEVRLAGGVARSRWQALGAAGEPLLDRLAQRVGGAPRGTVLELERDVALASGSLMTDAERLQLPSPLDVIRITAGLVIDAGGGAEASLGPGVFGLLGYDLVDAFEALPPRRSDPAEDADVSMVLAGDVAVWNHATGRVEVITRGLPWETMRDVTARHQDDVDRVRCAASTPVGRGDPGAAPELPEWSSDLDRSAFGAGVEALQRAIADGEVFQAVLSRGMRREVHAPSDRIYERLARANPSPYMFHADLGDGVLLGASPEASVRVRDGQVEIRPIAGTAPRGFARDGGIDRDLDRRLGLGLLLDPKEQAEHAMLLDLARNDVARAAVPASTEVVQQFALELYSHVQHLVSRVRGRLRPGWDALHAYRAAANMGTLTGAPKVRAMELVRALEPQARGAYGGAFGYLLADGTLDTCIVIRSLRIRDGVGYLRVGAGIVADSVAEREWMETCHKARAVQTAVALAEATGGSR